MERHTSIGFITSRLLRKQKNQNYKSLLTCLSLFQVSVICSKSDPNRILLAPLDVLLHLFLCDSVRHLCPPGCNKVEAPGEVGLCVFTLFARR